MQSLTAGPKISPSREFPGLEAGRSRRSEGAGINGSSTERRPAGPVLAAALIGGLLEATGPGPGADGRRLLVQEAGAEHLPLGVPVATPVRVTDGRWK
jgi:hypothetical protein